MAGSTRASAYLSGAVLGGAFGRRELAAALAALGAVVGVVGLAHLVLGAGNGGIDGMRGAGRVGVGGQLLRGRWLASAGSHEVLP